MISTLPYLTTGLWVNQLVNLTFSIAKRLKNYYGKSQSCGFKSGLADVFTAAEVASP